MKRALVTAANCFIGRRLCKELSLYGYKVYAVVREQVSDYACFQGIENLVIIKCNMEQYMHLSEIIDEKCDLGVTLAWDGTRGDGRNDSRKQELNYIYSQEAIKSFIRLKCTTIVTAGSQAEYGPWVSKKKIKETEVCNPNTQYGIYKLKLYNWAKNICEKECVRLIEPRFFSLYGDDDSTKTMIISMVRSMLKNEPCYLTDCVQLWDFLYVDDAIDALIRLIVNEDACGIYNFGSGISRPLKEYVEEMHALTNTSSMLNYGAVPYPVTGIVHTNPDVGKLIRDASWKPKISFSEGIEKVINFQKEII